MFQRLVEAISFPGKPLVEAICSKPFVQRLVEAISFQGWLKPFVQRLVEVISFQRLVEAIFSKAG